MDSKFASIKGNNNYFPIQKLLPYCVSDTYIDWATNEQQETLRQVQAGNKQEKVQRGAPIDGRTCFDTLSML